MSYGCYNRPPLRDSVTVFDGYCNQDRTEPFTRVIPDPMSRECQYTISTPDPQCAGCKHEAKR